MPRLCPAVYIAAVWCAMQNDFHRLVFMLGDRSVAAAPAEQLEEDKPLAINVIFTSESNVRAALKGAGKLAQNLKAHLNLIVVKEVPLAFALGQPPVPATFTANRLYELASEGLQGAMDIFVQLYYCRNKPQALLQALAPESLVVMGGRPSRWPSKEKRLARLLLDHGHQVIFAGSV